MIWFEVWTIVWEKHKKEYEIHVLCIKYKPLLKHFHTLMAGKKSWDIKPNYSNINANVSKKNTYTHNY